MFQIPVQNLDNIRRSRKKVKGILVDIGLDSCQELLQTLKSFDPGEKYFSSTSWNDVSHWDNVAKRKRYRTNPYCCSLCKFSSKFLNSFKNHLTRYHEDEMDQEIVVPCPECSFASQSKIVGKHLRMFHSKKKIQNYSVSGGMRQFRNDAVNFVCQKCQFSDMLYYNTKKHVLVSHFQNLISAYFEERPDESEENFTDHYCKKCNAFANSRDSLIYHVLTSEVHKDLENILGRVISVQPKKTGQTKSLQIINIAPKPSSPGILAINQPIGSGPGVLPVPQTITSGVLRFNHPVTPGVLPVNPSAGPGIVQFNQPVTPEVLPVNQSVRPGVSQNATLLTTGPVLRQLIPTGKQVNGIPTYTLAPVSFMPSVPVAQLSQGPATVPSPVAVSSTNTLTKTSPTSTAMNLVLKQAKQWKTCPVCSELFPSNVYQVHMQVAHKCNKVAVCAPFLRWLKDKTVRCFSCKCFLTQAELLKHIFIHGLTCLFCTSIFYDLKSLVTHTQSVHNGKKELHSDYNDKGFQLASDSEGHLVFPHFDFSITSKELCEREVHLVVLAGVNSRTLIPLYIKLQQEDAETSRENKKVSTCPFCYGIFTNTDAYEMHLKERHHIMPTVHTILKTPAFKCIHCCGVYTGNMTLTAIAVHLLRCRSAPKETSPSDHLYAAAVSEDQSDEDPPFFIINNGTAQIPVKEVNCVPSKRQKSDHKTETKGETSVEDLNLLVLNPKPFQQSSNEVQKRFLADYFHKKPYPSKKELELLSSILCAWKVDVASFFGRKRYFCLKAIKNFKPSVLLGFSMSELKNVKHSLNLKCELEDV
uniref:ADNP homeobox 2 n=1 Tax=Laticauda laticaudata TaxID=8630 RepID=A0A8C5RI74_LATLA